MNNISNAHRTHQANLSYCLILQNRLSMQYVPTQFIVYYINSKRRFFLYFKFQAHLKEVMSIFDRENVKYHRRNSLFPDREELQQILYHCNFKHKQKDIRRNLKPNTILNQPKGSSLFPTLTSQYREYREQNRLSQQHIQPKQKNMMSQFFSVQTGQHSEHQRQGTNYFQEIQVQQHQRQRQEDINFNNFNNQPLKKTKSSQQHQISSQFKSVRQESYADYQQRQRERQKEREKQRQRSNIIQIQQNQSFHQNQHQQQIQFVADFGHIKIRNPQVLRIINNKELIKRLFQAEKLR